MSPYAVAILVYVLSCLCAYVVLIGAEVMTVPTCLCAYPGFDRDQGHDGADVPTCLCAYPGFGTDRGYDVGREQSQDRHIGT